jgi:hypothetical protein
MLHKCRSAFIAWVPVGRSAAKALSLRLPTAAAPGSLPVLFMLDMWWTERHWGRFSPSTSVALPIIHSINCSTIITVHQSGLVQQANKWQR